MAIYTVELDGKQYDLEGDHEPTEEDVRQAIGSGGQTQDQQQPQQSVPQMLLSNLIKAGRDTVESAGVMANTAGFGIPGLISQSVSGKNVFEGADLPEGTKMLAGAAGMAVPVAEGINIAKNSQLLKPLLKWENSLQLAQKAKKGLDTLRGTLGKGVEVAIKDVENVVTDLNVSDIPDKVLGAMKKKVYGLEFTQPLAGATQGGELINTVGNLRKLKESVYDMLTSKDFIEASTAEKREIVRFGGKVSDVMRKAAAKAGKPIDEALDSYGNFMEKYRKINSNLVDKYGEAMGNKLKATFKLLAEPATKEAWKAVSKASPEIKAVMNSMQRRELLKNILKVGAAEETLNPSSITRHMIGH